MGESHLNVGFVSLSEALDLTTPSGRALAGMLAIFAEFEHDTSTHTGLRDRALLGYLACTFARIGAAVNLKVEDYYPSGKRYLLRFKEKGARHALLCPFRGLISDEEKTETDAREQRRGTAGVFDKQVLIFRRYSGVSQRKL